ncbi:protein of unknown function [Streptomyces sp. KY75]|nr:protein of unknown function [Streptomyces sp. KY75]CAD5982311.1 protein of unknown function [Streptomyces sp. KY70]
MISAIRLGGSEAPGRRPECHRTRAIRDLPTPDRPSQTAHVVPGDSRSGIASTQTGNPVSWRYVVFLTYVTQRRATGARGHADQAGRSQGRAARTGCPGS